MFDKINLRGNEIINIVKLTPQKKVKLKRITEREIQLRARRNWSDRIVCLFFTLNQIYPSITVYSLYVQLLAEV